MNYTPIVRQYGTLNNNWGALLCQKGSWGGHTRWTQRSRSSQNLRDTRTRSNSELGTDLFGRRPRRSCRWTARPREQGQTEELSEEVKEDLLAEVQWLHAENAYLKNLQAIGFGRRATPAQKNAGSSKTEARLLTAPSAFNRSTASCNLLLPFEEDGDCGQI